MTRRAGRAALLAAAAVVLGIAAHGETGADGGALASSPATVALVGAIAVATALVALRPARPACVGLLLGGTQLALHLALDAGATAAHASSMGHMGSMATVSDPAMVTGHLLVTAVVTAGVVGADRALALAGRLAAGVVDAAVATARLLVPRTPAPASPAAVSTRLAGGSPVRRPAAVLLTRSHPRRGPPRAACRPSRT